MVSSNQKSKYYLTLEPHGLVLGAAEVIASRCPSPGGHLTRRSCLVNVVELSCTWNRNRNVGLEQNWAGGLTFSALFPLFGQGKLELGRWPVNWKPRCAFGDYFCFAFTTETCGH